MLDWCNPLAGFGLQMVAASCLTNYCCLFIKYDGFD